MTFKVGDLVKLKSGGPIMTITRPRRPRLQRNEEDLLDTVFFHEGRLEVIENLDPLTLMKVNTAGETL